ncbi:hypothetical protein D3C71_2169690 [compost metagenome]
MLHVGKNQLLMLLFVVQAQLHQGVEGRVVAAQTRDQVMHGGVDMLAILLHVG